MRSDNTTCKIYRSYISFPELDTNIVNGLAEYFLHNFFGSVTYHLKDFWCIIGFCPRITFYFFNC